MYLVFCIYYATPLDPQDRIITSSECSIILHTKTPGLGHQSLSILHPVPPPELDHFTVYWYYYYGQLAPHLAIKELEKRVMIAHDKGRLEEESKLCNAIGKELSQAGK